MDGTQDPISVGQLILAMIAILIAVLTLYFGYLAYKRAKQKRLTATISEPIALIRKAGKEQNIEIRFQGEIVKDPQLITYRFENSGTGAIRNPGGFDGYERPIHVPIGEDIKVIKVDVTDKKPGNLSINTHIDEQKLIVSPVLLNERNAFTLNIIVSEKVETIPDWHIENVDREVKSISDTSRSLAFVSWIIMLAVGFILSTLGIGFFAELLRRILQF